jgi:hypothetical protein
MTVSLKKAGSPDSGRVLQLAGPGLRCAAKRKRGGFAPTPLFFFLRGKIALLNQVGAQFVPSALITRS